MQYFLQLIQSSLLRWCKDNPFAIEFSNLCFHYTKNKYCDCDKPVTFFKSFHQVVLKSESQLVLTVEPGLCNRSICYKFTTAIEFLWPLDNWDLPVDEPCQCKDWKECLESMPETKLQITWNARLDRRRFSVHWPMSKENEKVYPVSVAFLSGHWLFLILMSIDGPSLMSSGFQRYCRKHFKALSFPFKQGAENLKSSSEKLISKSIIVSTFLTKRKVFTKCTSMTLLFLINSLFQIENNFVCASIHIWLFDFP